MKKIRTEEAVGYEILHDLTQIVQGGNKGPAFKRGHLIKEEDLPLLLAMGKSHIYVKEEGDDENLVFEEDAAYQLAELCMNKSMELSDISEGKLEIFANEDGFLTIDRERLTKINEVPEISLSTRLGNLPVKKGDKLAAMRVVPLFIKKEQLAKALAFKEKEPLLTIHPFQKKKVGLIVTGREVYQGIIKDGFTEVIKNKLAPYQLDLEKRIFCDDNKNMIIEAIKELKSLNCNLILLTGGMSVDPDDLTPGAIMDSGAEIVTYGSPVLPGAMFLLAYDQNITFMGLPASVMHANYTVFDIILPYALADVKIDKKHMARLAYGGLSLAEDVKNYPYCQFGKGV